MEQEGTVRTVTAKQEQARRAIRQIKRATRRKFSAATNLARVSLGRITSSTWPLAAAA